MSLVWYIFRFILSVAFYSIICFIVLLWTGRIIGFIINTVLRVFFLPYDTKFSICALQFYPLQARVMFTRLKYVTKNFSIRIVDGHITFAYWIFWRQDIHWRVVKKNQVHQSLVGSVCRVTLSNGTTCKGIITKVSLNEPVVNKSGELNNSQKKTKNDTDRNLEISADSEIIDNCLIYVRLQTISVHVAHSKEEGRSSTISNLLNFPPIPHALSVSTSPSLSISLETNRDHVNPNSLQDSHEVSNPEKKNENQLSKGEYAPLENLDAPPKSLYGPSDFRLHKKTEQKNGKAKLGESDNKGGLLLHLEKNLEVNKSRQEDSQGKVSSKLDASKKRSFLSLRRNSPVKVSRREIPEKEFEVKNELLEDEATPFKISDVEIPIRPGLLRVHLNGVRYSLFNNTGRYEKVLQNEKIRQEEKSRSNNDFLEQASESLDDDDFSSPLEKRKGRGFSRLFNRSSRSDTSGNTSDEELKASNFFSHREKRKILESTDRLAEQSSNFRRRNGFFSLFSRFFADANSTSVDTPLNIALKKQRNLLLSRRLLESIMEFIRSVEIQIFHLTVDLGMFGNNSTFPFFLRICADDAVGSMSLTYKGIHPVDLYRNRLELSLDNVDARWMDTRREPKVTHKKKIVSLREKAQVLWDGHRFEDQDQETKRVPPTGHQRTLKKNLPENTCVGLGKAPQTEPENGTGYGEATSLTPILAFSESSQNSHLEDDDIYFPLPGLAPSEKNETEQINKSNSNKICYHPNSLECLNTVLPILKREQSSAFPASKDDKNQNAQLPMFLFQGFKPKKGKKNKKKGAANKKSNGLNKDIEKDLKTQWLPPELLLMGLNEQIEAVESRSGISKYDLANQPSSKYSATKYSQAEEFNMSSEIPLESISSLEHRTKERQNIPEAQAFNKRTFLFNECSSSSVLPPDSKRQVSKNNLNRCQSSGEKSHEIPYNSKSNKDDHYTTSLSVSLDKRLINSDKDGLPISTINSNGTSQNFIEDSRRSEVQFSKSKNKGIETKSKKGISEEPKKNKKDSKNPHVQKKFYKGLRQRLRDAMALQWFGIILDRDKGPHRVHILYYWDKCGIYAGEEYHIEPTHDDEKDFVKTRGGSNSSFSDASSNHDSEKNFNLPRMGVDVWLDVPEINYSMWMEFARGHIQDYFFPRIYDTQVPFKMDLGSYRRYLGFEMSLSLSRPTLVQFAFSRIQIPASRKIYLPMSSGLVGYINIELAKDTCVIVKPNYISPTLTSSVMQTYLKSDSICVYTNGVRQCNHLFLRAKKVEFFFDQLQGLKWNDFRQQDYLLSLGPVQIWWFMDMIPFFIDLKDNFDNGLSIFHGITTSLAEYYSLDRAVYRKIPTRVLLELHCLNNPLTVYLQSNYQNILLSPMIHSPLFSTFLLVTLNNTYGSFEWLGSTVYNINEWNESINPFQCEISDMEARISYPPSHPFSSLPPSKPKRGLSFLSNPPQRHSMILPETPPLARARNCHINGSFIMYAEDATQPSSFLFNPIDLGGSFIKTQVGGKPFIPVSGNGDNQNPLTNNSSELDLLRLKKEESSKFSRLSSGQSLQLLSLPQPLPLDRGRSFDSPEAGLGRRLSGPFVDSTFSMYSQANVPLESSKKGPPSNILILEVTLDGVSGLNLCGHHIGTVISTWQNYLGDHSHTSWPKEFFDVPEFVIDMEGVYLRKMFIDFLKMWGSKSMFLELDVSLRIRQMELMETPPSIEDKINHRSLNTSSEDNKAQYTNLNSIGSHDERSVSPQRKGFKDGENQMNAPSHECDEKEKTLPISNFYYKEMAWHATCSSFDLTFSSTLEAKDLSLEISPISVFFELPEHNNSFYKDFSTEKESMSYRNNKKGDLNSMYPSKDALNSSIPWTGHIEAPGLELGGFRINRLAHVGPKPNPVDYCVILDIDIAPIRVDCTLDHLTFLSIWGKRFFEEYHSKDLLTMFVKIRAEVEACRVPSNKLDFSKSNPLVRLSLPTTLLSRENNDDGEIKRRSNSYLAKRLEPLRLLSFYHISTAVHRILELQSDQLYFSNFFSDAKELDGFSHTNLYRSPQSSLHEDPQRRQSDLSSKDERQFLSYLKNDTVGDEAESRISNETDSPGNMPFGISRSKAQRLGRFGQLGNIESNTIGLIEKLENFRMGIQKSSIEDHLLSQGWWGSLWQDIIQEPGHIEDNIRSAFSNYFMRISEGIYGGTHIIDDSYENLTVSEQDTFRLYLNKSITSEAEKKKNHVENIYLNLRKFTVWVSDSIKRNICLSASLPKGLSFASSTLVNEKSTARLSVMVDDISIQFLARSIDQLTEMPLTALSTKDEKSSEATGKKDMRRVNLSKKSKLPTAVTKSHSSRNIELATRLSNSEDGNNHHKYPSSILSKPSAEYSSSNDLLQSTFLELFRLQTSVALRNWDSKGTQTTMQQHQKDQEQFILSQDLEKRTKIYSEDDFLSKKYLPNNLLYENFFIKQNSRVNLEELNSHSLLKTGGISQEIEKFNEDAEYSALRHFVENPSLLLDSPLKQAESTPLSQTSAFLPPSMEYSEEIFVNDFQGIPMNQDNKSVPDRATELLVNPKNESHASSNAFKPSILNGDAGDTFLKEESLNSIEKKKDAFLDSQEMQNTYTDDLLSIIHSPKPHKEIESDEHSSEPVSIHSNYDSVSPHWTDFLRTYMILDTSLSRIFSSVKKYQGDIYERYLNFNAPTLLRNGENNGMLSELETSIHEDRLPHESNSYNSNLLTEFETGIWGTPAYGLSQDMFPRQILFPIFPNSKDYNPEVVEIVSRFSLRHNKLFQRMKRHVLEIHQRSKKRQIDFTNSEIAIRRLLRDSGNQKESSVHDQSSPDSNENFGSPSEAEPTSELLWAIEKYHKPHTLSNNSKSMHLHVQFLEPVSSLISNAFVEFLPVFLDHFVFSWCAFITEETSNYNPIKSDFKGQIYFRSSYLPSNNMGQLFSSEVSEINTILEIQRFIDFSYPLSANSTGLSLRRKRQEAPSFFYISDEEANNFLSKSEERYSSPSGNDQKNILSEEKKRKNSKMLDEDHSSDNSNSRSHSSNEIKLKVDPSPVKYSLFKPKKILRRDKSYLKNFLKRKRVHNWVEDVKSVSFYLPNIEIKYICVLPVAKKYCTNDKANDELGMKENTPRSNKEFSQKEPQDGIKDNGLFLKKETLSIFQLLLALSNRKYSYDNFSVGSIIYNLPTDSDVHGFNNLSLSSVSWFQKSQSCVFIWTIALHDVNGVIKQSTPCIPLGGLKKSTLGSIRVKHAVVALSSGFDPIPRTHQLAFKVPGISLERGKSVLWFLYFNDLAISGKEVEQHRQSTVQSYINVNNSSMELASDVIYPVMQFCHLLEDHIKMFEDHVIFSLPFLKSPLHFSLLEIDNIYGLYKTATKTRSLESSTLSNGLPIFYLVKDIVSTQENANLFNADESENDTEDTQMEWLDTYLPHSRKFHMDSSGRNDGGGALFSRQSSEASLVLARKRKSTAENLSSSQNHWKSEWNNLMLKSSSIQFPPNFEHSTHTRKSDKSLAPMELSKNLGYPKNRTSHTELHSWPYSNSNGRFSDPSKPHLKSSLSDNKTLPTSQDLRTSQNAATRARLDNLSIQVQGKIKQFKFEFFDFALIFIPSGSKKKKEAPSSKNFQTSPLLPQNSSTSSLQKKYLKLKASAVSENSEGTEKEESPTPRNPINSSTVVVSSFHPIADNYLPKRSSLALRMRTERDDSHHKVDFPLSNISQTRGFLKPHLSVSRNRGNAILIKETLVRVSVIVPKYRKGRTLSVDFSDRAAHDQSSKDILVVNGFGKVNVIYVRLFDNFIRIVSLLRSFNAISQEEWKTKQLAFDLLPTCLRKESLEELFFARIDWRQRKPFTAVSDTSSNNTLSSELFSESNISIKDKSVLLMNPGASDSRIILITCTCLLKNGILDISHSKSNKIRFKTSELRLICDTHPPGLGSDELRVLKAQQMSISPNIQKRMNQLLRRAQKKLGREDYRDTPAVSPHLELKSSISVFIGKSQVLYILEKWHSNSTLEPLSKENFLSPYQSNQAENIFHIMENGSSFFFPLSVLNKCSIVLQRSFRYLDHSTQYNIFFTLVKNSFFFYLTPNAIGIFQPQLLAFVQGYHASFLQASQISDRTLFDIQAIYETGNSLKEFFSGGNPRVSESFYYDSSDDYTNFKTKSEHSVSFHDGLSNYLESSSEYELSGKKSPEEENEGRSYDRLSEAGVKNIPMPSDELPPMNKELLALHVAIRTEETLCHILLPNTVLLKMRLPCIFLVANHAEIDKGTSLRVHIHPSTFSTTEYSPKKHVDHVSTPHAFVSLNSYNNFYALSLLIERTVTSITPQLVNHLTAMVRTLNISFYQANWFVVPTKEIVTLSGQEENMVRYVYSSSAAQKLSPLKDMNRNNSQFDGLPSNRNSSLNDNLKEGKDSGVADFRVHAVLLTSEVSLAYVTKMSTIRFHTRQAYASSKIDEKHVRKIHFNITALQLAMTDGEDYAQFLRTFRSGSSSVSFPKNFPESRKSDKNIKNIRGDTTPKNPSRKRRISYQLPSYPNSPTQTEADTAISESAHSNVGKSFSFTNELSKKFSESLFGNSIIAAKGFASKNSQFFSFLKGAQQTDPFQHRIQVSEVPVLGGFIWALVEVSFSLDATQYTFKSFGIESETPYPEIATDSLESSQRVHEFSANSHLHSSRRVGSAQSLASQKNLAQSSSPVNQGFHDVSSHMNSLLESSKEPCLGATYCNAHFNSSLIIFRVGFIDLLRAAKTETFLLAKRLEEAAKMESERLYSQLKNSEAYHRWVAREKAVLSHYQLPDQASSSGMGSFLNKKYDLPSSSVLLDKDMANSKEPLKKYDNIHSRVIDGDIEKKYLYSNSSATNETSSYQTRLIIVGNVLNFMLLIPFGDATLKRILYSVSNEKKHPIYGTSLENHPFASNRNTTSMKEKKQDPRSGQDKSKNYRIPFIPIMGLKCLIEDTMLMVRLVNSYDIFPYPIHRNLTVPNSTFHIAGIEFHNPSDNIPPKMGMSNKSDKSLYHTLNEKKVATSRMKSSGKFSQRTTEGKKARTRSNEALFTLMRKKRLIKWTGRFDLINLQLFFTTGSKLPEAMNAAPLLRRTHVLGGSGDLSLNDAQESVESPDKLLISHIQFPIVITNPTQYARIKYPFEKSSEAYTNDSFYTHVQGTLRISPLTFLLSSRLIAICYIFLAEFSPLPCSDFLLRVTRQQQNVCDDYLGSIHTTSPDKIRAYGDMARPNSSSKMFAKHLSSSTPLSRILHAEENPIRDQNGGNISQASPAVKNSIISYGLKVHISLKMDPGGFIQFRSASSEELYSCSRSPFPPTSKYSKHNHKSPTENGNHTNRYDSNHTFATHQRNSSVIVTEVKKDAAKGKKDNIYQFTDKEVEPSLLRDFKFQSLERNNKNFNFSNSSAQAPLPSFKSLPKSFHTLPPVRDTFRHLDRTNEFKTPLSSKYYPSTESKGVIDSKVLLTVPVPQIDAESHFLSSENRPSNPSQMQDSNLVVHILITASLIELTPSLITLTRELRYWTQTLSKEAHSHVTSTHRAVKRLCSSLTLRQLVPLHTTLSEVLLPLPHALANFVYQSCLNEQGVSYDLNGDKKSDIQPTDDQYLDASPILPLQEIKIEEVESDDLLVESLDNSFNSFPRKKHDGGKSNKPSSKSSQTHAFTSSSSLNSAVSGSMELTEDLLSDSRSERSYLDSKDNTKSSKVRIVNETDKKSRDFLFNESDFALEDMTFQSPQSQIYPLKKFEYSENQREKKSISSKGTSESLIDFMYLHLMVRGGSIALTAEPIHSTAISLQLDSTGGLDVVYFKRFLGPKRSLLIKSPIQKTKQSMRFLHHPLPSDIAHVYDTRSEESNTTAVKLQNQSEHIKNNKKEGRPVGEFDSSVDRSQPMSKERIARLISIDNNVAEEKVNMHPVNAEIFNTKSHLGYQNRKDNVSRDKYRSPYVEKIQDDDKTSKQAVDSMEADVFSEYARKKTGNEKTMADVSQLNGSLKLKNIFYTYNEHPDNCKRHQMKNQDNTDFQLIHWTNIHNSEENTEESDYLMNSMKPHRFSVLNHLTSSYTSVDTNLLKNSEAFSKENHSSLWGRFSHWFRPKMNGTTVSLEKGLHGKNKDFSHFSDFPHIRKGSGLFWLNSAQDFGAVPPANGPLSHFHHGCVSTNVIKYQEQNAARELVECTHQYPFLFSSNRYQKRYARSRANFRLSEVIFNSECPKNLLDKSFESKWDRKESSIRERFPILGNISSLSEKSYSKRSGNFQNSSELMKKIIGKTWFSRPLSSKNAKPMNEIKETQESSDFPLPTLSPELLNQSRAQEDIPDMHFSASDISSIAKTNRRLCFTSDGIPSILLMDIIDLWTHGVCDEETIDILFSRAPEDDAGQGFFISLRNLHLVCQTKLEVKSLDVVLENGTLLWNRREISSELHTIDNITFGLSPLKLGSTSQGLNIHFRGTHAKQFFIVFYLWNRLTREAIAELRTMLDRISDDGTLNDIFDIMRFSESNSLISQNSTKFARKKAPTRVFSEEIRSKNKGNIFFLISNLLAKPHGCEDSADNISCSNELVFMLRIANIGYKIDFGSGNIHDGTLNKLTIAAEHVYYSNIFNTTSYRFYAHLHCLEAHSVGILSGTISLADGYAAGFYIKDWEDNIQMSPSATKYPFNRTADNPQAYARGKSPESNDLNPESMGMNFGPFSNVRNSLDAESVNNSSFMANCERPFVPFKTTLPLHSPDERTFLFKFRLENFYLHYMERQVTNIIRCKFSYVSLRAQDEAISSQERASDIHILASDGMAGITPITVPVLFYFFSTIILLLEKQQNSALDCLRDHPLYHGIAKVHSNSLKNSNEKNEKSLEIPDKNSVKLSAENANKSLSEDSNKRDSGDDFSYQIPGYKNPMSKLDGLNQPQRIINNSSLINFPSGQISISLLCFVVTLGAVIHERYISPAGVSLAAGIDTSFHNCVILSAKRIDVHFAECVGFNEENTEDRVKILKQALILSTSSIEVFRPKKVLIIALTGRNLLEFMTSQTNGTLRVEFTLDLDQTSPWTGSPRFVDFQDIAQLVRSFLSWRKSNDFKRLAERMHVAIKDTKIDRQMENQQGSFSKYHLNEENSQFAAVGSLYDNSINARSDLSLHNTEVRDVSLGLPVDYSTNLFESPGKSDDSKFIDASSYNKLLFQTSQLTKDPLQEFIHVQDMWNNVHFNKPGGRKRSISPSLYPISKENCQSSYINDISQNLGSMGADSSQKNSIHTPLVRERISSPKLSDVEQRELIASGSTRFSPQLRFGGDVSVNIEIICNWLGFSQHTLPNLLYLKVCDPMKKILSYAQGYSGYSQERLADRHFFTDPYSPPKEATED